MVFSNTTSLLSFISSEPQKLQLHCKLSFWFATGFFLDWIVWEGCCQRREKYAWNNFLSVLAAKLFVD
jgi:hypothetical protein